MTTDQREKMMGIGIVSERKNDTFIASLNHGIRTQKKMTHFFGEKPWNGGFTSRVQK